MTAGSRAGWQPKHGEPIMAVLRGVDGEDHRVAVRFGQSNLRIEPVPVEEPTAAGAYVRDANGDEWYRSNADEWWYAPSGTELRRSWRDLPQPVRVLFDPTKDADA